MAAVVCLGDASVDLVSTVAEPLEAGRELTGDMVLTIGGFGAVCAAWLVAEGQSAVLLASVGQDAMGQYIKSQSQRRGVRADLIQTAPRARTGATMHITDQDGARTRVSDPGANAYLSVSSAAVSAIEASDLLVMSAATYIRESTRDACIAALDAARASGTAVAVDTATAVAIAQAGPAQVRRFLDQVDIIIGNDEEVAALTSDQPSGWLGSLPNLIIKHGAGGASWWSNGVAVTRRPSRVTQLVDASGAGDAFDAAALAVLVRSGDLIEIPKSVKQQALEAGATAAAAACEQLGAWPA